MEFETLLMPLVAELVIIFAIDVPVMLAHYAFRLGFNPKVHQISKLANRKSIVIDIVAIVLSICELVIGIMMLPHIHYVLKWLFAVVDFGIILLSGQLEVMTAIDYFRNKKELKNHN